MQQEGAVAQCLSHIEREADIRSAALVAANAMLASRIGHYDAAEAWFKIAIERAPDVESMAALVYRSSLALLRRGRTDCIALLEASAELDSTLSAALRATLATAYVMEDRLDDARSNAHVARDLLVGEKPLAQRPRTLYQIGYVALRCGEFGDARVFAREAVEAARRAKDDDLASRGYSLLYELAYHIECDPLSALRYVELVDAYAARCGDTHVRTWALMAQLYIEIEAGNAVGARTREETLSAIDVVQNTEETSETLVPAQALRCAWKGDFARAYRLVTESAESQITPDHRAGRFSEIALYAAASGETDAARAAIESAEWMLAHCPVKTKAYIQARAFCALAAALAVGVKDAQPQLERLSALHGDVSLPMDALVGAVEAVCASWNGARNHDALLDAFAALRAHYLGGLSMLFEALPIPL